MKEYRTTLDHDTGGSTFVELGPIPELPPWHVQSNPSRWPFPKEKAAFRFAESTKADHPNREVVVVTPDGERFVL
ncbi:hypothetical protein SEA_LEVIATHAN_74 [Mycobacterium Phage Leviathan]|uniref:Uncharacterized protein n=3 Tax=Turbidovirus turbido TaxID=1993865 RepID=A0A1D8EZR7_9CAUD|nr:hypothetical protein SEA_JERM_74 [Mycobacterium phage Jerm]AYD86622.1 hypothetical protein SEA_LILTURB_73 [Mycobacterium phage LilTurb]QWS69803.1 hypothetical protein SEA_LEVIATHAN_74 [Mycobacterium Phage Leviathan]QZD98252.1 hypothetical protein SEA_DIGNITY_74 [Mycobacterium phage Dignity]